MRPEASITSTLGDVSAFCRAAFLAAGADEPTSRDATRSMMHGSVYGVDSHGVRLLPHYIRALQNGRLNKAPKMRFEQVKAGTGLLNSDNAQGARATYHAIELAMKMARETGIAAVGIQHTSHFGPAGAFSIEAAKAGLLALVFGNSDSFVRLHDGASRFHGTNPISVAVPSGATDPWLLDMATSSVPYNRVELYQSLGVELPPGVASDKSGVETLDPNEAEMLAPLGTEFGFKGAALGGVAEIFSAVLTGMRLSPDILPMGGPDMVTPREMGAFVIVMDPAGFVGADIVGAGMTRYLAQLRASPARAGRVVMAPGDREWAEAARRRDTGVPLDPVAVAGFRELGQKFGLDLPF